MKKIIQTITNNKEKIYRYCIIFCLIILIFIGILNIESNNKTISRREFKDRLAYYLVNNGFECDTNDDGVYDYCQYCDEIDKSKCDKIEGNTITFYLDDNLYDHTYRFSETNGHYSYSYYYLDNTLDYSKTDSVNSKLYQIELIYNFNNNDYNCIRDDLNSSYFCSDSKSNVTETFESYTKFQNIKSEYLKYIEKAGLDDVNIINNN